VLAATVPFGYRAGSSVASLRYFRAMAAENLATNHIGEVLGVIGYIRPVCRCWFELKVLFGQFCQLITGPLPSIANVAHATIRSLIDRASHLLIAVLPSGEMVNVTLIDGLPPGTCLMFRSGAIRWMVFC